jgi:cobalamin-dependent methionine synthase I
LGPDGSGDNRVVIMDELILIGEKINYSIPRTGRLLDRRDYPAIQRIAVRQEQQGAHYIDVNVGPLSPDVMKATVVAVTEVIGVPVCVDSTDPSMLEAGIGACVNDEAGPAPILNSAVESNADRVLGLRREHRCQVVLLVSERLQEGMLRRNATAEDAHGTARKLVLQARQSGFAPEEIYIDPGTPAIASDTEGLAREVLRAIELVRGDSDMRGTHILLGISNFTVGLPGGIRLPLQRALLTLAVRRGLDAVIADPGKRYGQLEPGNPYLSLLEGIMAARGTAGIGVLTSSGLYRSAVAADKRHKAEGYVHRRGE